MSVIAAYLSAGGLGAFIPAFKHMQEQEFLGLLMQDYAKYGVVEMEVGCWGLGARQSISCRPLGAGPQAPWLGCKAALHSFYCP